jgi:hypothetical protein
MTNTSTTPLEIKHDQIDPTLLEVIRKIDDITGKHETDVRQIMGTCPRQLFVVPKWSFMVRTAMLVVFSMTLMVATPEAAQSSLPADHGNKPTKPLNFFAEMSQLKRLGQDVNERPAVLKRLHTMWETYDVLRRPAIAYLMCQFGDRSGVEPVEKAFFAGDYDTGRELEPDGAAAGANATDDAFRMLILYGTPEHHQELLSFLKLSDDPLRKRDDLCRSLLGLSSDKEGPGLPVGYPKERFPLELAIACLDFREEVDTIVVAPGGSVESHMNPQQHGSIQGSLIVGGAVETYSQRGCDYAAQTIQNLTARDFGHHVKDPVSQRDKAIKEIKKWWVESHDPQK